LEDKGKTFDIFKKFATRAQNEFGSSMVKSRSDNGSEFRNTRVEEYCDGEGIKHEFSSTYTPQQNGVVERKNKTMGFHKGFGRKLSTRHVMLQINCISTDY
jgi:transposase InsO family protein